MDSLHDIDQKHIWHPFTPLVNNTETILINSAEGVYLKTKDGRKIIDAISSWWVNLHGHANPHIAKAVSEQALKLEHVIFAGFTHEPAIQLAKNLISILPNNQSKVFFSDNGSTAVEVALKMAMQYWFNQGIEKKKIIAFEGAYHGDTFGAMAVGSRGIFTSPFNEYLFEVEFIPLPTKENTDQVVTKFTKLIETGNVGAFIFEPLVQAAAGMRMYTSDLLDTLIREAYSKQVICIADEVFTGFGRTGRLFASDFLKHKPDIIAISKGITGGTLPLGVTSCSDKIISPFTTDNFYKTFFHGHSYTANPIACAAANASFELLMNNSCQANIQRITQNHQAFLSRIKNNKKLKEVRNCGTILAIELHNEEETSYTNSLRKKIYSFFLQRNILLRPLGNVLYLVPPYIINDEELNYIYSSIEEFIESL